MEETGLSAGGIEESGVSSSEGPRDWNPMERDLS